MMDIEGIKRRSRKTYMSFGDWRVQRGDISALLQEVARLETEAQIREEDTKLEKSDRFWRHFKALEQENTQLRELLKSVEWADNSAGEYNALCPVCDSWAARGHEPECRLEAALKGEGDG